uniref:Reverse transcriptase domain-containing protein n=1 Tax=Oncorhynchus kisutch TaxID=8019 RepID=A0A8C7E0X5_ONCKI
MPRNLLLLFCPQRSRRPVLIAFSRTLILLLLCSAGDVEVNPGPACPQAPSFVDFCDRKSLGFMHVNIRSLLPKFVLLTALAHSANPDVLAVSESWLRKATKNSEISIPNYNIFRQDRTAKGGGVAVYCRDSLQSNVILSRSIPKQFELLILKITLSRNKSLTVAACYRPPSAPSCALDTICELIAPHLASEFVLLGDLNWDMLNTPPVLQSKLDALNLTQIIKEPTRYNPNSVNKGTENFNKHFSTAGHAFRLATSTSANSSAPPAAPRPSLSRFSFTQIQIADVLKELQNLDPYKSAGLDNLDPLFLKLSATIVATPITSLFNLSFISSEIPKDWKAAAVIPLFKGGDTLDPNCYRPISILPCLSKVFESQVNKQVTDHLESHRTFSAVQSGFRAGHGCTSATLKVLNDIITAIDKRQYCAAVFIDLAKAFDSVNHHILIGRLSSLGFSDDCLVWFTNYFADRVQCVKSEGMLSGPLAVSMGVPQGSILGPTLFSVYINDVALAAGDSLIHLYADDTILYTFGPSLDTVLSNLQTSFNAIQHSFRGLQLLLNASKTKCMLFNRSLPAPACPTSITTLDGSDLEYVDVYKYLGVWLDCKLSFQTHIKHLQSKIKSRVGFLFRNKASFTHAAKLTLVKLTILPILDFGDVIYKMASNTLLSKLDAVYHSAIRFVTKAPYTTHHCDLYALVGWPSLHIRRQTHWLQVIYKSMLGKAPPYLSSLVTMATPIRSTRSSRCISLIIPKANTSFGRLSFQYSAACDWNELQKSLKLETFISLTNFKHQLSEQLTDRCSCT